MMPGTCGRGYGNSVPSRATSRPYSGSKPVTMAFARSGRVTGPVPPIGEKAMVSSWIAR